MAHPGGSTLQKGHKLLDMIQTISDMNCGRKQQKMWKVEAGWTLGHRRAGTPSDNFDVVIVDACHSERLGAATDVFAYCKESSSDWSDRAHELVLSCACMVAF